MSRPVVTLAKGKERTLGRRHPWIFSGALTRVEAELLDGEVVDVHTSRGEFVAIGHYNRASIAVRVLSWQQRAIDHSFWRERLGEARALRTTLALPGTETNAYRLICGEGDQLPGLIVDVYGSVAVFQAHAPGMLRSAQAIAEAIVETVREVTAVIDRSKDTESAGWLVGSGEGEGVILEHGHSFRVNWQRGQKTGFFLDQRENRALLARYAPGRKVLNAFCFTGGFSVYAAKAGAAHVLSVDSSADALALAQANLTLNDIPEERASCHKADCMKYLRALPDEPDLIILDPPAFAKSKRARHAAVQAYKRLNEAALRQLPDGGILFTFSCTQVVSRQLFEDTIAAAAFSVGRHVRLLERMAQPADHPVSVSHPEGSYLKGLVLIVTK